MEQFSKVSKWIGKVANDASKKSNDLIETARLNTEIGRIECEKEEALLELGKAYYLAHQNEENPEYAALIAKVKEYNQEIKLRNDKLLANKGLTHCRACGEVVDTGSEFCSKCGAKIETEEPVEEEDIHCRNCGAAVEPGQQFCNACGFQCK
ncbi:zinc ribbon domain-containing protein [Christensenellaceae bacterium OttesenSCG-928-L17]|nr:zinc ribbon domain-containing protein [Christensenellaceae bacterium OttesenSCG-928-L17]